MKKLLLSVIALPAMAADVPVKVLYTELGGTQANVSVNTFAGVGAFPTFIASQQSLHQFTTVRVGVNYHFN